jgi:mono/diheme cytochrome c family protein
MPESAARAWRSLLWTLLVAAGVWGAAAAVGFPPIFRWFFVGYVMLAWPFYLLLNARPARPPRRPLLAVVSFFVVVSGLLTAAGALLPQYDPRVEQEKIRRLQQAALEREEARRLEALRQVAARQGLQLVPATETGPRPGAPAATPAPVARAAAPPSVAAAPDAKLVAQGQQVYNDYECYNCHKLGGKGGVKRRGPELDDVGTLVAPTMLRAKILDPLVFMTEGYEEEYRKVIMPDDYKDRMGPKELDALVAYLSSLKAPGHKTPKPLFRGPKGWVFIPPEFQKLMPEGWWTDEKIVARGKQLYEGAVKSDVTCAACHGRDGQPVLTGARDFRDQELVAKMSPTYWFWRVAAGVPGTPMTPMRDKLTDEEIWQVIAYQHTFSHGGKAEEHAH